MGSSFGSFKETPKGIVPETVELTISQETTRKKSVDSYGEFEKQIKTGRRDSFEPAASSSSPKTTVLIALEAERYAAPSTAAFNKASHPLTKFRKKSGSANKSEKRLKRKKP